MAQLTAEERLEAPVEVNTEVKDTGVWAKALNVTIPAADVTKEFDAVAGEIGGQVNLPGFRAGKVPRNVIEKKFGEDIKKQVTSQLLQRGLRSAISKEKLDVVGEPKLDEGQELKAVRGEALTFKIEVEVKPTFELGQYKGLSIEQEEVELLPNEFEEAMDRLRERFAENVEAPAGHALGNNDVANGVLRILVEGVEVHKEEDAQLLLSDGHVLGAYAHLGSKYLEGAKAGEKRTVEETLSGNFPVEAQRGKKATIEFEIKTVKVRKLPELSDELATKVGAKSVDDLKGKVRTSLLERIKEKVENSTRTGLMEQILAATPFEVPARLTELMARRTAQNQLQYFAKMGMPPEMFASQMEGLMEESKKSAVIEIRQFFVLNAVCEKENLNVVEEDIDAELVKVARQRNMRASELYDQMTQNDEMSDFVSQLKSQKTLEYLIEQADIKIVPRKPVVNESASAGHEHVEHAPAGDQGHEHGHDCGHEHGHEHGH